MPSSAATSADGDQLTIVAAAYPFQFVAERVAGAHGQVSSLTQPGSEPHDLELTPQQTASVIDADLVVYEKTFQAAVDEAVAQSGGDNALDTTTVVPLQDLGTSHDHGHGEGAEEHVAAQECEDQPDGPFQRLLEPGGDRELEPDDGDPRAQQGERVAGPPERAE